MLSPFVTENSFLFYRFVNFSSIISEDGYRFYSKLDWQIGNLWKCCLRRFGKPKCPLQRTNLSFPFSHKSVRFYSDFGNDAIRWLLPWSKSHFHFSFPKLILSGPYSQFWKWESSLFAYSLSMPNVAKSHIAWLANCPLKTQWGSLIPRPLKMNEGLSTSNGKPRVKNGCSTHIFADATFNFDNRNCRIGYHALNIPTIHYMLELTNQYARRVSHI